ncbi:MAG: amidohydrolase family protein [Frankiaceae bacterium]|nr:amidohydrolase family protein [Frankiaceae bacterium]MBV9368756.1 amidohydrolase family protein [Frankiales bacterium]
MRLRPRSEPAVGEIDGGLCLRGPLWLGSGPSYDDGRVLISADGLIADVGAARDIDPDGFEEIRVGWVGPGLVDAHVHLGFGEPDHVLRHGVVKVRDLGAPPADAARYRNLAAPRVEVAGPLLTAPGGYPSRSWGSAGYAAFVDDPDQVERLVAGLCTQVDVIKLALEPSGGQPVPSPEVAAAVVRVAHDNDREVTCHALTVAMVERALDAGVDELAHTPTEALPSEVIQRLVSAEVRVVSTLQTFVAGGGPGGAIAVDNARRLVEAGVTLRYGTDLGNAGTRPGADPKELRLLDREVGLGPEGALRVATEPIVVGTPAAVVGLSGDPMVDPGRWRDADVVVVGATVLRRH